MNTDPICVGKGRPLSDRIFQPVGNSRRTNLVVHCLFSARRLRWQRCHIRTDSWDLKGKQWFNPLFLLLFAEHLHSNLKYFDIHKNESLQYKFKLTSKWISCSFYGNACWTCRAFFFLPLFYKQSSMKNIHDCWQVPVCGLCFSQFSPWKPQMVGIRMTMADIIIQMVLVVADREQWWWCALLRDDDVSSSCETKMNHLTLCYGWIPALIYLSSFFSFFFFHHPSSLSLFS